VSTLSPARRLDLPPADAPRPARRLGELARRWRRAAPAASPALARSRRLRRSGRAVILWALALYALAQPALLAFMDWWHPSLYENSVRDKWRQLRELTVADPDRPLLVMVGSSRTEAAFQAGRLDGLPGPGGRPWLAYNFGVPTAGPLREALYLREMLDAGIRPRLLLVEYLPPLFGRTHPDVTCEEGWTHAEWLSLTQLCRLWPYFAERERKRDDWLTARLAPAHAFRVDLQSPLNGDEDIWPVRHPHDRWGWRLAEERPPQLLATMRQTAWNMYFATLCRFQLGKGPCRAMRDVLALCRRERIPVVLVLTPEGSVFRGWYSPEAREGPRRLLENLRAAYGVPVIDATGWLPDEDFTDGHHVTGEGATAFTGRLLEELRRLPEWSGAEGPQVAAR